MSYNKPMIIAQNSAAGSFAAGCPAENRYLDYNCLDCERSK